MDGEEKREKGMVMDMSLLEIRGLETEFQTEQGVVKALRGIDYTVDKGEVLGIVGESGSGKSVGMLSLMGLLAPNGTVTAGEMIFDGEDISPVKYKTKKEKKEYEKKMNAIRGNDISMIFQDPMSYLNPIVTIEKQMTEGIRAHDKCSKQEARERAIELMKMVGIPAPESRLKQYPFEFSGGMRQRIIIAIALACNPKLIVADEPTTALDVTVQAQILDLLRKITEESDAGVIIITHDLGVVASLCDRISIMYGGNIMEEGTTDEIFYDPKHPYTKGLFACIPNLMEEETTLIPIEGMTPDPTNLPTGCRFHPRCPYATEECSKTNPASKEIENGHHVKCLHI